MSLTALNLSQLYSHIQRNVCACFRDKLQGKCLYHRVPARQRHCNYGPWNGLCAMYYQQNRGDMTTRQRPTNEEKLVGKMHEATQQETVIEVLGHRLSQIH